MLSNLRASVGLMTILAQSIIDLNFAAKMGGGFKNKNVTLSPRLKTITRTKIITFKTNHQSASPEFRGLGFPDQYHACGSRQILKEKARQDFEGLGELFFCLNS